MEFNAALKVSSMLPNGAAALADLGLERTFAAVAFFAATAFKNIMHIAAGGANKTAHILNNA